MPISIENLIRRYPKVFQDLSDKPLSEEDVYKKLSTFRFSYKGSLDDEMNIRHRHFVVTKLIAIGDLKFAVELAEDIISKAQAHHMYYIVLELCDLLIFYYLFVGNMEEVNNYETLYRKIRTNANFQRQTMKLVHRCLNDSKRFSQESDNATSELIEKLIASFNSDKPRQAFYRFLFLTMESNNSSPLKEHMEAIEYFDCFFGKDNFYSDVFSDKMNNLTSPSN